MEQSIFKTYINFVKKPDFYEIKALTFSQKIKGILKIYLITLLLLIIICGIINYSFFDNRSMFKANVNEISTYYRDFLRWYFIFGLFCPPILEELAFRLLLTKFDSKMIFTSLSLIIGIILYSLFQNHLWHSSSPIIVNLVSYVYPIIFAFPIYIVFFFLNLNLAKIWGNHFSFVFYFFTTLFALFHILKLKIEIERFYFLPVILLPYFILSFTLGFIRVKFGIYYSVVIHFLFNAPLILKQILKHI